MMRIFLVDDQNIELFHMRVLFKHCPHVCVVGEATNVEDAARQINELQPDAIFMDVDLGAGKTGFDILPLIETSAKIIFVTLYNEYAVRAFRVNAMDYLMKPVNLERLSETLVRLNQQMDVPEPPIEMNPVEKCDRIHLKEGGRQALVPVDHLCAIEASGDYTHVFTRENGVYFMRRPMKEWQRLLPEDVFAVLDRKLMVARHCIREIYSTSNRDAMLTVEGVEQEFELGKTALKEARRLMLSEQHISG